MARPALSANRSRAANPALRLAAIRQLHAYLGAFIAPSVLFFASTGALQLFNLHEAHGDYHPPALFETLGRIHKDQRLVDPPKHAAPKTQAKTADHADVHPEHHDRPPPTPLHTQALKWLLLIVAVGLIASTSLGVWMAVTYARRKNLIWLLLGLGAVLPVLLLFI